MLKRTINRSKIAVIIKNCMLRNHISLLSPKLIFRFLFHQDNFHNDSQLLHESSEGSSRRQKYVTFRSESRLHELNNLYVKSLNKSKDSVDTCHEEKNLFLSFERLQELTLPGVFIKDKDGHP